MFNMLNALPFMGYINRQKADARSLNAITATDYYDRLKSIALSMFEWDGLPETCNVRYLEHALFYNGRALFFYDDTLGHLTLKCTPSGELNVYEESVSYTAFSTNYNQAFKREDCVLIRNNYLEKPTDLTVMLFASRLTEAERTIDVNIKAQKTPVLIRCEDEKTRLSMKNLYDQYDGNEPFISGSKNINPDSIKVFKTDAPFIADKLQNYKREIWNEALTFLGINNANTDKRERLVTDEVNANNELISIMADVMLLTREEACEQINKKYGLNVSVKMRSFREEETEWQDTQSNLEQS